MAKRVYLCDGHGNNTAGKRTPTYSNGSYIRENTFNKAVVKLLVNTLKYQGISPLEVAPEDTDTALATRTNRANADYKKKAFSDYIYLSVHYNAMGSTWNENVGGLETYYYPGSTKGKKLATAVQKYLLKGVTMKNRGVKSANFHVLRETNMTACLAECGFMDNPDESLLMTSVDYQTECANEITQGIENSNYEVIEDRKDAIKQALSLANSGDIVLIAGKGHEDYQIIKNNRIYFDDRQEVRNFFNVKP